MNNARSALKLFSCPLKSTKLRPLSQPNLLPRHNFNQKFGCEQEFRQEFNYDVILESSDSVMEEGHHFYLQPVIQPNKPLMQYKEIESTKLKTIWNEGLFFGREKLILGIQKNFRRDKRTQQLIRYSNEPKVSISFQHQKSNRIIDSNHQVMIKVGKSVVKEMEIQFLTVFGNLQFYQYYLFMKYQVDQKFYIYLNGDTTSKMLLDVVNLGIIRIKRSKNRRKVITFMQEDGL